MSYSLIILLISHFLGDFYLQTSGISKSKKDLNTSMLFHIFIYMIPFLGVALFNKGIPLFLIFIGLSHLLIDIGSVRMKELFNSYRFIIFCLDQVLHLLVLVVFSYSVEIRQLVSLNLLTVILALLIILKPASIFIGNFLQYVFKDCEKDDVKIGRYIGYLERIIVFILCYFDSIATIGFIIAAKTMVRYKEINNNNNHFQEKYLIGTLLSTIVALCCYALIML